MNRGSALKWIDALLRTDAHYDCAQLGFMVEGERHLSPSGVLCDFLDPHGWETGPDGVSLLWHGEQFRLPPAALARCKMKTDGYTPIVQFEEQVMCRSLAEVETEFRSHRAFANFVREAYPAI